MGNRLQEIINGNTTTYAYDPASRLLTSTVSGQTVSYSYDNNGNLLTTGAMTNTWDAINRLTQVVRDETIVQPHYNGLNQRVAQSQSGQTSYYALDVATPLPEVIDTSEGNTYLHLPGLILTENLTGTRRYLLSDGLGSIRHIVDDEAKLVSYQEYDPYGQPIINHQSSIINPYGFTGEWWETDLSLLHLRARWYAPELGTFLSVDPVETEPAYQYVQGNPTNLTDPTGMFPDVCHKKGSKEEYAKCVMDETGLWPATLQKPGIYYMLPIENITIPPFQTNYEQSFLGERNKELYTRVSGSGNCWEGPVPYIGVGYIEGAGGYLTLPTGGVEKVYDLASMEREQFVYRGGQLSYAIIGGGVMLYSGGAKGFRSNYSIEEDYGGLSVASSAGVSLPTPLTAGVGYMVSRSVPSWQVASEVFYFEVSASIDPLPILDVETAYLNYSSNSRKTYYARSGQSRQSPLTKVHRALLVFDILYGNDSPYNSHPFTRGSVTIIRTAAVRTALSWADKYDDMYFGSRLQ